MLARPVPAALVAALLALAATSSACRPDPVPPSVVGTTGTGTADGDPPAATTFAGPDACQSSEDCETEGSCVAPYDPGSDPPMGQGGCVEACIELDDLTRWCFDDAACCGNARCNVVDGLCEPGPGSDDTGSGTDIGTGTSTGAGTTDTGTGTESSSGTSAGSSSSSSSGSGTSTSTG